MFLLAPFSPHCLVFGLQKEKKEAALSLFCHLITASHSRFLSGNFVFLKIFQEDPEDWHLTSFVGPCSLGKTLIRFTANEPSLCAQNLYHLPGWE